MFQALVKTTRPFRRSWLLAYALAGLVLPAQAETTPPTATQTDITREIDRLTTQLDRQKQQSDDLNDEVSLMEKKLGDISRQEHETEQKIEATLLRLREANTRKEKLDTELQTERSALAQQLQAMYTAGEQSHLRLLLRQDNPSDISRTLRYFEYLNAYRTAKIKKINGTLEKIRTLTSAMEQDRLQLTDLETTLSLQKKSIQGTVSSREAALKRLESDIQTKQARLEKLHKDEAKLQAMVERIAARAEQEEQAALNRQAQAADVPQASQPAALSPEPVPVAAEKPPAPAAEQEPEPTPPAPVQPTTQPELTTDAPLNGKFSTLKGRLPSPVNGNILHPYGTARNEKQNWQGVVIAAPGGSKVQAVARGKVAFAGWMDAYGHLIIIEHDKDYISLYGYNRAVYKKEGQMVNAGEVIAAVGNSSGQSENALYFEIRRKAVPQNPAQWLR